MYQSKSSRRTAIQEFKQENRAYAQWFAIMECPKKVKRAPLMTKLICLFKNRPHHVFSRQEILDHIYPKACKRIVSSERLLQSQHESMLKLMSRARSIMRKKSSHSADYDFIRFDKRMQGWTLLRERKKY